MIYVGIDDTDMPDCPGTNKLARAMADSLADEFRCVRIVRHQLSDDPRVPRTSKNSSACLAFAAVDDKLHDQLLDRVRGYLESHSIPGSDPGLCVAVDVPRPVMKFGARCQVELVKQGDARLLARQHGLLLEGLGGTEDGVIGAIAAVGLTATGNDGRIVRIGTWPDDLAGRQTVKMIRARDVEVVHANGGPTIETGLVDLGKRLRPNYRNHRHVLFVQPHPDQDNGDVPRGTYQALKLP